jgi:hypothetical protein
LLSLKFITGIDLAEFVRRLDQFVSRMRPVSPELLQVANIGGGGLNRSLEFKKRHAQKRLHCHGQQEPREHDESQEKERFGLIETLG